MELFPSEIWKQLGVFWVKNKNETLKWLNEKMNGKIIFEDRIISSEKAIRGIYGIFVCKGSSEYCAYIGRANNIYERFFCGSKAHLVKIRKKRCENDEINEALLNEEAVIKIKILEEVECKYDSYVKDMQRLASAENFYIDKYQELDQCLNQLPDGKNMKREIWDAQYELLLEKREQGL